MRLHANNDGFRWQAPVGPLRRLDAAALDAWNRDGALVVEQAFDRGEVAAVAAMLDPFAAASDAYLRRQAGGRMAIARAGEITFSPHLVAADPGLAAFSRHRLLLDIAADLVGYDVRLYWDQAVYKACTRHDFPWHQDNGYTYVEPQQYLTCWIALSDTTVDNGCPWIIPGAHRLGTLAHRWTDVGFCCFDGSAEEWAALQRLLEQYAQPPAGEPRPLPLQAGAIAVFSSLTPHRTGPNPGATVRKSYILQYAPEGAVMYPADAPAHAADHPDWQYPVLRGGFAA